MHLHCTCSRPSANSVFEVSRIRAGSGDNYAQFGLGGSGPTTVVLVQVGGGGGGVKGLKLVGHRIKESLYNYA